MSIINEEIQLITLLNNPNFDKEKLKKYYEHRVKDIRFMIEHEKNFRRMDEGQRYKSYSLNEYVNLESYLKNKEYYDNLYSITNRYLEIILWGPYYKD